MRDPLQVLPVSCRASPSPKQSMRLPPEEPKPGETLPGNTMEEELRQGRVKKIRQEIEEKLQLERKWKLTEEARNIPQPGQVAYVPKWKKKVRWSPTVTDGRLSCTSVLLYTKKDEQIQREMKSNA